MIRSFVLAASLSLAAAAATAATPPPAPATPPAPTPTAAVDPALLAVRETAWRAWFAGDEAALAPMLPDEFLGIGTSGTEMADRAHTLAASRAFHESGGRLVRLAFPQTRAQQYGDVVLLYSLYEATLVGGDGKETTLRGRATELFVRRDGRWLHPGWHLDTE